MRHIKAADWVAEVATATTTGFKLRGTSQGYGSFGGAFTRSQEVFYSAHDESGNRESGHATFNGSDIIERRPTATLVNGVYSQVAPPMVRFTGEITVACTFDAAAFNLLWESLQALDPDGDGSINIPPELIQGLGDSLSAKAEKVDLDKEIQDRKNADKSLQDQIDNIDVSGGAEYDDTQIKADLATETHARIDGDAALYARIDEVEGNVSGGGGFVEAPNDGKLYGRQSEAWAEVPDGGVSDWADIENKPTEFPPEAHDHAWDDVTGKPTEFPPETHDQPWSTITDKPAEFPPEDHTHDYLSDAPDDGAQYARQSVNNKMVWSAVSGESLVHVDDDAPENPATGQLWFDTDNGTLNLFDGNEWVAIGSGGDVNPPGYDDTKAIASGVMTAGEMAVLNDDGTVSVVKESVETGGDVAAGLGNKSALIPEGVRDVTVSYDPPTDSFLVAYVDGSENNKPTYQYGVFLVAKISGDDVIHGTPVVFNSTKLGSTNCISATYDPNTGSHVIAYSDYSGAKKGSAIVATVSGDTVTIGTDVIFENLEAEWISSAYDSKNGKHVITYRDAKTSNNAKAIVGAVSGDTIAFGPSKTFSVKDCKETSAAYDPVNEKILVTFRVTIPNETFSIVGDVSGNEISFNGSPIKIQANGEFPSSVYDPSSEKVAVALKSGPDANKGKVYVGVISGNSVAYSGSKVFSSSSANTIDCCYDSVFEKVIITYSSNSKGMVRAFATENSKLDAEVEVKENYVTHTAASYSPVAARSLVIAGKESTTVTTPIECAPYSSGGTIPDTVSTNLTADNFIGVSKGDYADGAEATVQIAGINDDQQGMTVGKQYVLPDGSLTTDASSGGGGDYEVGTPEVFNNGSTSYGSTTYDPVNNKVVIAYTDNGNSGYGTALVGDVSGDSIAFGTPVVFNSRYTSYISSTYDPVADKVVIAYNDVDPRSGTAVAGTVSGDSISFGTPEVFSSNGGPFYTSTTYDSSADKVVIAYRDSGNSSYGTAVVGAVSGDSITFGTPVVFNSNALTNHTSTTYDPVADKAVIAYGDNGNSDYGTVVIGTVSGSSITFGTPVVFNNRQTIYGSATYEPASNKVVIAYRDYIGGGAYHGAAIVGTVSGDSITFGTSEVFYNGRAEEISTTYDSGDNRVIMAYRDHGNSGYATVIAGVVSGGSITFDTPSVLNSGDVNGASVTYDSSANQAVIVYGDEDNSTGTAVTYGAEAGEPNVFAGTAISSTELNIKDTV